MTRTRRTVTWIVVALSLLAAAIGLLLVNDGDNDNDDDQVNTGAIVLAASVAALAGALIYTMAMDDYEVRRRVLGEEADRRGEGRDDVAR